MFRRLFLASAAAGLVAGLSLTGLQAVGVTPLILEAEGYETSAPEAVPHSHGTLHHSHALGERPHEHGDAATGAWAMATAEGHDHGHGHGHGHDHGEAWAPADGLERTVWTAVSNVGLAIGFALILGALFAWRGEASWREGLLWGVAGYVVFFANPALGLHPELPGTEAAPVLDRQLWWLLAMGCSAAGVCCLILARPVAARVAGAVLLVVPHVIGAPHPEVAGALAPETLVSQFIVATTVVNGVFWLVLGVATAIAYRRLVRG